MPSPQRKEPEAPGCEELEKQIKELREDLKIAEEKAKSKSAFMASLSYEIRTPLNSIIGIAGLFQGTRLDLEQKKFVEMLSSSAKDLLGLIEELLDLSLIETGKLTLRDIPFPIRALSSRTVHPMALSVQERRLTLELTVDPGVPEYLRGDGTRLAQILRNMAANAIALTSRGAIDVKIYLAEETPSSVLLAVEVSHPAEKTDVKGRKPEASEEGMGMDLLIACGVANSMGGEIKISKTTEGDRIISFEAPMGKVLPGEERMAGEGLPEEKAAESLPENLTVLIVDDNRFNRSLTRTILRKMGGSGWKISLAEGGQEALDLMMEEKFDLILMDVQMPGMDGLECTRQIRMKERKEAGEAVAIIAMTAYAMEGDRQRCLDAGMDDYIAKPVEADELKSVIGKNLPQRLRINTPRAD